MESNLPIINEQITIDELVEQQVDEGKWSFSLLEVVSHFDGI